MTTAAQLKAMAAGGTQVSKSMYHEGSTDDVGVYQKNGVIYWTSGMSIDCDGLPGTYCNGQTDPYFQAQTSWTQSNGKALPAEELPFIVVPLPSSIWKYSDAGIVGGNLVTVVYKDRYVHGVVGDQGPSERIGEASYATAQALGINPSPTSGGVESGVTYIVYPGVKVNPIEDKTEAIRLGELKAMEWLGVTTDPTFKNYTVTATDTLTGIAAAQATTVDAIVKYNDLAPVGKVLTVSVDPVPPTTKPVTYVAKANDTWDTIAAQYGITAQKLLELNNIKVAPGSSYIVGYTTDTPPTPVPVDPYAAGLPVINSTDPSAIALQTELRRVGYLDPSVVYNDNYGPKSQAAVAAFHAENPQFSTSSYDPQIGQAGWLFLRGMTAGTGNPTPPMNTPGQLATGDVTYDKTSTNSGKAWVEGTVIPQALAACGLSTTDEWVKGYSTLIVRESSYLPNSVNTTDSNATGAIVADGNPFQCSRGLAQCIPQTFARYHQAGTPVSIYDPVANVAASINYVRAVYGVANDGSNLASKVQQADPNRSPKGY